MGDYNIVLSKEFMFTRFSLMKSPSITTVVDGRNKTLYIPVRIECFQYQYNNCMYQFCLEYTCYRESNETKFTKEVVW